MISKATNQDIAISIEKAYLRKIDNLPEKVKAHLAGRLFSVTGKKSLIKHIVFYHQKILPEVRFFIDALNIPDRIKYISEKLYHKFPLSNYAQKNRHRFLKKQPEIIFYNRLATNLCYWKKFNILPNELAQAISKIETLDISRFFTEELILNTGVSIINLSDYLEILGIEAHRDQLRQKVKDLIEKIKEIKGNSIHYQNLLYGLTHFIINDTFYYEYLLENTEYQWILDFFTKDFADIKDLKNLDVLAEIGLSFVLCQQPCHLLVDRCQKSIKDNFEPGSGIIKIPQRSFSYLEHVNVVSFLLLTCPKSFFSGPNLSKYFN